MRNSIALWLLSAIISVGAHAGTLAALSKISLPRLEEQRGTELLVTSTAFDDLFQTEVTSTTSAAVVNSKSEAELVDTEQQASESLAPQAGESVAALEGGIVDAAPSSALQSRDSDAASQVPDEAQTNAVNNAALAAPAQSTQLPADASGPSVAAASDGNASAMTALPSVASATVADDSSMAALPSAPSATVADNSSMAAQSSADAAALPSGEQAASADSGIVAAAEEGSLVVPDAGAALTAKAPSTLEAEPSASTQSQPITAGTTSATTSASTVEASAPASTVQQRLPLGESAAVPAVTGGVASSSQTKAAAGQEVGALAAGTVVAARGPEVSAPLRRGDALAPLDETTPPAAKPPRQTAAVAGAAMSQAERIGQFLKTEGNRPCIYAKPGNLNTGRPTFTGYGGGKDMIAEFASEFQKAVGVDPRVAMRPVMEAQCPAVDFIRNLRATSPRELAVIIDNQQIADYGNLIGHLEGELAAHVLLLLIDDDGAVQDISSKLVRKGDTNVFAERAILRGPESKSRYQMLMALSSARPLTVEAAHVSGEALKVFKGLAQQLRQGEADLALGIASFKID